MPLPVQKFKIIPLLQNTASQRKSYFYNVSGFASYYPCAFSLICIQKEKWSTNNNSNNYTTINNICHNYRKQCKYQKLAFEIKKQWQLNMIIVTPLVFSAMAVNPNILHQSPTNFSLLP